MKPKMTHAEMEEKKKRLEALAK